MNRHKIRILILTILLLGLCLRLFPVRIDYHYWDETVYLQHAEILTGESPDNYNEFEFRPPLLPLLLTIPVALSSSIATVHLFIALLSTAGIYLTYKMVEDFYGKKTGLIAAAAYATSPLVIKLSHDVLVDPILPLFWILTVFSLYRGLETGKTHYYALTGVFAALAVLMKFTSLVLVPAIAIIILLNRTKSFEIRELFFSIKEVSVSKFSWATALSFILTLAPYLAWSWHSYGSPLHVFKEALAVSGATDPFLTYVHGIMFYLFPVFYLGVAAYIYNLKNGLKREEVVILTFILFLYLPMQFAIGNKELRFLTPAIPFLSAVAAKGFTQLPGKGSSRRIVVAAVAALLLAASVLSLSAWENRNPVRNGLVQDDWHPPIEDAAAWLKENTSENATLYTNYRYPALGYYSKRKIEVVGFESGFIDKLKSLGSGYIYYSESSPHEKPSLEALRSDPRIKPVKSFDETVYLFYYGGSE